MTLGLFTALTRRAASAGGIEAGGERATWAELAERAAEQNRRHDGVAGRCVTVHDGTPIERVAALAALDAAGAQAVLARAGDDTVAVTAAGEASAVGILSSGTTGAPHLQTWSWGTLVAAVRVPAASRGGRWVSFYPLDTFAGVQALLFGVLSADELVLADARASLATACDGEARVVMATPSIWRRILVLGDGDPDTLPRVQVISMGGEAADQPLLDRLAQTFPHARIVHVYASSELGSVFSVSDGRAGFPQAWLETRRPSGIWLTVTDGVLHVSRDPSEPPIATGDEVRLDGDRVLFRGRRRGVINVGGRKVRLEHVAAVLREAPVVLDARVYGIPSRLVGSIVGADIVLAAGTATDAVHAHCRARLAAHERPRRITVVPVLPIGPTGKGNL